MSILFDRLKSNPILDEVSPDKTPFSLASSEGAPYLFFKGEEFYDLMGCEIKYYDCGVLLVFKDKHKEHENESLFKFFNNDGVKVFEWSNIKHNGYDKREKPIVNINLTIRQGLIQVQTQNTITNETEEYFVRIKNGDKIFDVFETKNDNISSL